MKRFFSVLMMAALSCAPLAASAAIWEFIGGLNIEQSVAADAPDCGLTDSCTVVPVPYFGGGAVFASLDDDSGEFTWEYTFGGLSGPATAAHFHAAPPGESGGVPVPTPIGPITAGTVSGSTTLDEAGLMAAKTALTGDGTFVVGDVTGWYLNIHTALNPPGELRGQLFVSSVVPLPAAAWLMLSAVAGLFAVRRRAN